MARINVANAKIIGWPDLPQTRGFRDDELVGRSQRHGCGGLEEEIFVAGY